MTEEKASQDRPQKLTALLKDLMALRSLTPSQLANDLGMNPSNVTGFFKGNKNPTLSTLDRLAAALAVPAWRLLNTPQEIIADLQEMGLLSMDHTESTETTEKATAAQSVPSGSPSSEAPESPAAALPYDLLTVDPVTGETRLYRLIKP